MADTNIDDLLSLLGLSETILNYNSEIKTDISSNGGNIIYSYNNIIIATEISDKLYSELKKNTHIDYIEDIPLKKYGNINTDLIDQLDISTLTGVTSEEIDEGTFSEEKITSLIDGEIVKTTDGIAPTITNTTLTLSAYTNEWFNYPVGANGSLQLKKEVTTPDNYSGELYFNNNILSGVSIEQGIYNIEYIVTNDYGYDLKILILSVYEHVEIINTNLIVNEKFGVNFTYNIETNGNDIIYDIYNIPNGLTLTDNIISGIFVTGGTFNIDINITGSTGVDSKTLTVNVGLKPIITSSGQFVTEQYSGGTYYITPAISDTIYTIVGVLPKGLQLMRSGYVYYITGKPTESGIFNVQIKAKNSIGITLKNLTIIISEINIGWIINKY